MLKQAFKKVTHRIRVSLGLEEIRDDLRVIRSSVIQNYIAKELRENKKYQNKKRLNIYEYKLFSQFGEDGIIEEIFKRIGTKNKFFVEIGAGDGTENNTLNLLINNWEGLWIEAEKNFVKKMYEIFSVFLEKKKLTVKQSFVTIDNVTDVLKNAKVPNEFDLLSIDIDGNDYWIWYALRNYTPRVVIIEYNASLGKAAEWVMKYDKNHVYDATQYHGVSLKSLELLGKKLGYALVGCSFGGANAFFVRKDLVKEKFLSPATSENFYEAPKYFTYFDNGHTKSPKVFKDFVIKNS